MTRGEFVIEIKFNDGTVVEIGGDDVLFVSRIDAEGKAVPEPATLEDDRLNLIRLVREAEIEATAV